jgi:hypothetical protein
MKKILESLSSAAGQGQNPSLHSPESVGEDAGSLWTYLGPGLGESIDCTVVV